MRIRLTSGLLTPLALAGAVLCTLPSIACAWDEDRVQSEIQPYFGVWGGMYFVDRQDLTDLGSSNRQLSSDFFSAERPALGASLGVAYGRIHVGMNGGYQMIDGDHLPSNIAATSDSTMSSNYYYRYQVIPIDLSIDVALLPNKTPVNLLVGGSVGLGFVGMQLPIYQLFKQVDSTHTLTSFYRNDWNWNNYLLATIYAGARINLARRLNLEAQVGWRFLKSDEVDLSHGYVLQQSFQTTVLDSTGKTTSKTYTNIPVDLSAPYVRVDIRWTFSSQQERDEALSAERVRLVHDIVAMTPRYVARHQD